MEGRRKLVPVRSEPMCLRGLPVRGYGGAMQFHLNDSGLGVWGWVQRFVKTSLAHEIHLTNRKLWS